MTSAPKPKGAGEAVSKKGIETMNFGEAIEALKASQMVRRAGWNGKGMHLYLEDGHSMMIRAGVFQGQMRHYEPVICMFTAQGKHQPGWLASQADMLADDWEIVVPG